MPAADKHTSVAAASVGDGSAKKLSSRGGDPSDGLKHQAKATADDNSSKIKTATASNKKYTSLSAVFDEYDPTQPFDYEAFCEERTSKEREEKERKRREIQRKRADTLRYVSPQTDTLH